MSTFQDILQRIREMPRLAQVALVAVAAVSLGITVSNGQPQPMLRFHWSPPPLERRQVTADGDTVTVHFSPAVAYAVQESTGVRPYWRQVAVVPDTLFDVPYPYGVGDYRLRVVGLDSLGRMGPASRPSDTWRDDGPPGEPGQPTATLILR